MNITYLTEDPAPRYQRDLNAAKTRLDLERNLRRWRPLADDALAIVRTMDDDGFDRWRAGLAKERHREYAGDEWAAEFATILMPIKMFTVSCIAMDHHVPWGLAWRRCVQVGWNNVLSGEGES